jgi:hypothetical protein
MLNATKYSQGIRPLNLNFLSFSYSNCRKERKKLEKELQRKEKALAETAALLVLSKKANAIWKYTKDE